MLARNKLGIHLLGAADLAKVLIFKIFLIDQLAP
jgi:hypothetical protein